MQYLTSEFLRLIITLRVVTHILICMARDTSTRFRNITRRQAWLVVLISVGVVVWSMITTHHIDSWRLGSPSYADEVIYTGVIDKVREGQNYYPALKQTFAETGGGGEYSIFNWRLPTYAWILSLFPDGDLPLIILMLFSLTATICITQTCFHKSSSGCQLAVVMVLLAGSFSWCFYETTTYLNTEPWCEPILLIAISGYASHRWQVGYACTTFAIFLRELAMPFAFVAFIMSIYERRKTEAVLWILTAIAWLIAFQAHQHAVRQQVPDLPVAAGGWFYPTGMIYVLQASSMNLLTRSLPYDLKAIVLVMGILGLIGWKSIVGTRLTLIVLSYAIPFLFINGGGEYWGCLYTALIMIGFIRSFAAVRDLTRAIRDSRDVKIV